MVGLEKAEQDGLSDLVKDLIPDVEAEFGVKQKAQKKKYSKMQMCHLNGGCPRKSRKNCNECMSNFSGRMHSPDEFDELEDW